MRLEGLLVGPLFEDIERQGIHEIGRHDVVPASSLLPRFLHQMQVLLQRFISSLGVQMERAEHRDHVAEPIRALSPSLAEPTPRPAYRKDHRAIEVSWTGR